MEIGVMETVWLIAGLLATLVVFVALAYWIFQDALAIVHGRSYYDADDQANRNAPTETRDPSSRNS